MPPSELVSSSCSNSAQNAYFRSPGSQTSGDFMGSLLVAPGALKSQKIKKLGLERGEARKEGPNLIQIRSEATSGADDLGRGCSDRRQGLIEGRAAQTARGQGCKNRSQDLKRKDLGGVE